MGASGGLPEAPVIGVGFKAGVAEEEALLVDVLPDCGDVPVTVHDGQLGARQSVDERQNALVLQVAGFADDQGEVIGDEQCGIAVLAVIPVCGQADDPVVGDPAGALHIQHLHVLNSI